MVLRRTNHHCVQSRYRNPDRAAPADTVDPGAAPCYSGCGSAQTGLPSMFLIQIKSSHAHGSHSAVMSDALRKPAGPGTRPRIRIVDFLANLPGFSGFGAAKLGRLAAGTTEIEAPRGTVLCRRGDPCTGFHVVVFGQVKMSLQTDRGDEKVVEIMVPGMSFGEAALFLDKPHIVTAEALSDSKLLHLSRDVVLRELQQDSQFSHWLIMRLSERLYHQTHELENYFLRTGTERVVEYLLRGRSAGDGANAMSLVLPTKKGVIASRLNLTHEHFSRILHDLAEAGLIEVHGREIRIADVERLGTRMGCGKFAEDQGRGNDYRS